MCPPNLDGAWCGGKDWRPLHLLGKELAPLQGGVHPAAA
jgi:hypothetical protein